MNAKRIPQQLAAAAPHPARVTLDLGRYDPAPNYVGGLQGHLEQVFSAAQPRHTGPSDRARLAFLAVAGVGAWGSLAAIGTLVYVAAAHLLS